MKRNLKLFLIMGTLISGITLSSCKINYSYIDTYSNGLARVEHKSKWGYINESGDKVIRCKYSDASDFSGGYAAVRNWGEGEKFYFIDKTGKPVNDKLYKDIPFIKNGLAIVMNHNLFYLTNVAGSYTSEAFDTLMVFQTNPIAIKGDSMALIITKNNSLDFSDWYQSVFPTDPLKVYIAGKEGQWRLLDSNAVAISDVYESVGTYMYGWTNQYKHSGRFWRNPVVVLMTMGSSLIVDHALAKAKDEAGEMIFFVDDLLQVKKNNKWGYVNPEGKLFIPLEYDFASRFKNGVANVQKNKKYGCLDKNGKVLIPLKYDEIKSSGNYIILGIGKSFDALYCAYNSKGKEVLPLKYQSIEHDAPYFIVTNTSDKVGVCDSNGVQITPMEYDRIDNFSDGMAVVKKDRLYGFIDFTGKEVIPIQYDWAAGFSSDHKAWVKTVTGESIYIDKKGNKVGYFP